MKEFLLSVSTLLVFVLLYQLIRRLDQVMDIGRKRRQKLKNSHILTGENERDD